jgi:hypothetical protein
LNINRDRRISSAFTEFVDILPSTTCLDYRKKRVPSRFFHFVLAMSQLHFAQARKEKGPALAHRPSPIQSLLQFKARPVYQQKRQRYRAQSRGQ